MVTNCSKRRELSQNMHTHIIDRTHSFALYINLEQKRTHRIVTQTGRQTDRQTGKQTERQADRQTDKQADRQTDRQKDRPTGRQRDRQTHRQTYN